MHRRHAALAVAAKPRDETEHFPGPRQASQHVIVDPLHQQRVREIRIEFGDARVRLAGGRRVVQGIHIRFLHQEMIVGLQAMAHALRVEGLHITRVDLEARIRQRHRAADRVLKFVLVGLTGVQALAAQEGVAAGHQLAFERAGTKHVAVQDGLRDVVVGVGRVGIPHRLRAECGQRFRVFQVVKMLKAGARQRVLRRGETREQRRER